MALVFHFEAPEFTQQHYDVLIKEVLPDGKLPTGALLHVGGPREGGGWQVVDVWESQEALDRFLQERLIPAAQRLGVPRIPPPKSWPVHNLLKV